MGQERPDLWLLTEFSGHHDILSPQISPAHNILLSQSCIITLRNTKYYFHLHVHCRVGL